ncbi:MAG: type II toxin-antitoxin system TacA family antitoxin [Actinomycetota bacterium]
MTASDALPQKKQDRISLRATPRQVDVIDQAAEALQKNRSDFMLDVAVQEAMRVLTDRRTFLLGDQERDEFLQLLDRPPVEKPRLRALFERGSALSRE